jgi:DNA polymerase-3 subunit alpha
VHLREPGPIEALKRLMEREAMARGARGRVNLVLGVDRAREVELALPGGYKITPQIRAAVKSLVGVVEVEDI